MKIITFYLPQFHTIPENDEWWGEGFTEWVNVKKATPLFKGHNQPRVPLDNNYYNLLDVETLKWQAEIAKKHNIWGFCFYHYWFGNKMLLEKPMELLLNNTDIDIPFCISWANENWTNQWVSNSPKILIKQEYGDEEEWKNHFEYLLPFFKDKRYIKENNKPVVVIYKPTNIEKINSMIDFWNGLARENGFDGICFMSQISYEAQEKFEYFKKMDYILDYQPTNTFIELTRTKNGFMRSVKNFIKKCALKLGLDIAGKKMGGLKQNEYSDIWENIIAQKPKFSNSVPGCFVDWDNTPRKKNKGTVLVHSTPEKFKKYFKLQIENCKKNYDKNFMFMFAWNEWAEGGYLEPDEKFGYEYLNMIKESLAESNEIENDCGSNL